LASDSVKVELSPLRKVRAALSKARGDHVRAVEQLGTVSEELRELARRIERLKSRGGPFAKLELSWFAAAALDGAACRGSAEASALEEVVSADLRPRVCGG
jgi:hypothetical protein